jgi:hypothetical protein
MKSSNEEIVLIDKNKLKELLIIKLSDLELSNLKSFNYNGMEFIFIPENNFYVNSKYYLQFIEYRKYNRLNHFIEFSNELKNYKKLNN